MFWDITSLNMPSVVTSPSFTSPLVLLSQVRQRMTQQAVAARLQVTPKTISRWEHRKTDCPVYVQAALWEIIRSSIRAEENPGSFTFIDLFAGIGGMRRGFELAGGRCIFTSEWNPWAQKTYIENYGCEHPLIGDIVPYDEEEIPDHDVLLAGFPCQPFSIAGVSKKNSLGSCYGFECTTPGAILQNRSHAEHGQISNSQEEREPQPA